MRTERRDLFAYAAIALVGAIYAYLQLHSQWTPYDDEGYLLQSLREFVAGRTLYSDVYSQYGPFYYELFGGFFAATGIEPTNDSGRLIVIVVWVSGATMLGLLAQYVTGRAWIGWVTQAVAISLTFLANEPMHPLGLATLLTIAVMALLPWRRDSAADARALGLGAVCAALALVKVNQGLLAVLSIGLAALLVAPDRHRKAAATAALVLLPPALMVANLDDGLVIRLALLESAGLAAIAAASWRLRIDHPTGRWLAAIATGGLVLGAAVCAAILVTGTSPSQLVDGAIVAPSRHPQTTFAPLRLDWLGVGAALAGLALALVAATGLARPSPTLRVAGRGLAAAAIAVAAISIQDTSITDTSWEFPVFAALAWLAVRPAQTQSDATDGLPRVAAVLIAATGLLQVYPIAGTQRMAVAMAMLLVAGVIASDAAQLLTAGGRRLPVVAVTAGAAAFALCCLAAFGLSHPVQRATGAYADKQAIGLHGAEGLRVSRQSARAYRQIAAATSRCDPLVTYPGMNSFNIWTRKRPPTGMNTTSWMTLLDDDQQQRIVDAIEDKPRLCVLRNGAIESGWLHFSRKNPAEIAGRPLVRYLNSAPMRDIALPVQARRAGYRLLVRAR